MVWKSKLCSSICEFLLYGLIISRQIIKYCCRWGIYTLNTKNRIHAKPLFADVMDGYNGTVFAYGQTGSGKTFTMMVYSSFRSVNVDTDVFVGSWYWQWQFKGYHPSNYGTDFYFYCRVGSTFRVPGESVLHGNLSWTDQRFACPCVIHSLWKARHSSSCAAHNDNLQVHEEKSRGVYVKNLSDYYVSSAREVYEIMRQGGSARVVSATSESLCNCREIFWHVY